MDKIPCAAQMALDRYMRDCDEDAWVDRYNEEKIEEIENDLITEKQFPSAIMAWLDNDDRKGERLNRLSETLLLALDKELDVKDMVPTIRHLVHIIVEQTAKDQYQPISAAQLRALIKEQNRE